MKTHDELVAEVAADAGYQNEFLHLLKLRTALQASVRREHEEVLARKEPKRWLIKDFGGLTYGAILDTAAPLFSPQVAGYVRSVHLLQDALTNALRTRYALTGEQDAALLNDVIARYAEG